MLSEIIPKYMLITELNSSCLENIRKHLIADEINILSKTILSVVLDFVRINFVKFLCRLFIVRQ